ncbi:transposable element Tcb2 transposase [Trichonephila clavipes]|nr:transposable element Tcb2 transposase [Trichonephila clavipes]
MQIIASNKRDYALRIAGRASLKSSLWSVKQGSQCLLEPYEGAWLKDIWDRGPPLPVLSLTLSHRSLRLERCCARGNWIVVEWNWVIFIDEYRFNLSCDDNRVRVWKSRERLNPAFALQLHTAPTAGVMVWCAITYNTWSSLVFIRVTMTAQRYVHGILMPHVLPHMQWLPGALYQQDNARLHTARTSQAVTTLT